jgi:hypothetical protein
MKNDATQSGVSDEHQQQEGTAVQEPSLMTSRSASMEAMEAKRREELRNEGVPLEEPAADDSKKKDGEDAAGEEGADGKAKAHEADDQTRLQLENESGNVTDDAATAIAEALGGQVVMQEGKALVRTKVDGKEELVPLDKVVAQYQKNSTADVRLEEATRLLKEAKERQDSATTGKEKAEADAAATAAEENLESVKKKMFDDMYEGRTEEASAALNQIINQSVEAALKGRGVTATPDEAAVIARVVPAVEQSLAMKSALKQFRKDFPKIATDPYLATRADAFLQEAIDGGKPIDEAFKDAGEKTLGWMRDTLGIKSDVKPSTALRDRSGKKAELDNPSAAGAKTAVQEAPTEQNVAANIAEMRNARVGSRPG